jgi:hypothetical protein
VLTSPPRSTPRGTEIWRSAVLFEEVALFVQVPLYFRDVPIDLCEVRGDQR